MELEDKKLRRLATFSNYANNHNVFICDLVRLGYIYLGYDDALKCTGCSNIYCTWTDIEDLTKQHTSTAQNCVFTVGGRKTENDSVENVSKPNQWQKDQSNPGDSSKEYATTAFIKNVKYPSYRITEARTTSFQGAPRILAESAVSAAHAGFFFSGYNDHVRCFCCGGTLGGWQEGEDAWEEHEKWFPDCEFLRNKPHRKMDNKEETDPTFKTTAASENPPYEKGKKLIIPEQKNHTLSTTEELMSSASALPTTEELMSSAGALAVLEMGYSVEIVKSAIEIWKISSHKLEPSSLDIVNVILNNEELDSFTEISSNAVAAHQDDGTGDILTNTMESKKREQGRLSHRNEIDSGRSLSQRSVPKSERVTEKNQSLAVLRDSEDRKTAQNLQQIQHHTSVSLTEPSPTDDQETSNPVSTLQTEKRDTSEYCSIQREAQKLQDLTLCKICMVAGVNIVFMPCGHIVSCSSCSKGIKKCPLCRQKIKGTIKAYLS